jgi:hypothetical protein
MATVELLNEDNNIGGPYFTDVEGDLLILVDIDGKEYFVSVTFGETFSLEELCGLTPIGEGATFKVTI